MYNESKNGLKVACFEIFERVASVLQCCQPPWLYNAVEIRYIYLTILQFVTKFSKEIGISYIDSCRFLFKNCICYRSSNETLVYHIFTYIVFLSLFFMKSDNDVMTIITYILWIPCILFFLLNNVTVSMTLPHFSTNYIYHFLWTILYYSIYNGRHRNLQLFDIITNEDGAIGKTTAEKFWSPPNLLLNLYYIRDLS